MITVTHDGDTDRGERCCFCRAETHYWADKNLDAAGQFVACCQRCAVNANPEDLPTKEEWCRRERIADHRLVRT